MMKKKPFLAVLSIFSALALAGCVTPVEHSSHSSSGEGSSSQSSSSSAKQDAVKYLVTLQEGENGTLSTDRLDGKYEKGETVSLTLTITSSKFVFDRFLSEDVEITLDVENSTDALIKASFVMPEKNVTIGFALKENPAEKATLTSILNLSEASFSGIDLKEGERFEKGQTVHFTLKASGSYGISESYFQNITFYVNDVLTPLSPVGLANGYATAFEGSFVAGEKDVEIVFALSYSSLSEDGYTLSVEENENVKFYGFDPSKKYLSVAFFAVKKVGYKLEKIQATVEGSDVAEGVRVNSYSSNPNVYTPSNFQLKGNTVLSAVGAFVGARKITYVNSDYVTTSDKLFTALTVGDTLKIYNIKPVERYSIEKKATIEGVDTSKLTENNYNLTTIEFAMPDNDVTITFNARKNGQVHFAENTGVLSAKAVSETSDTEGKTYFPKSAYFYVFPNAAPGYTVSSASADDGQNGMKFTNSSGQVYFQFHMPDTYEKDITISFVTEKGLALTAEEAEGGKIEFQKQTYAAGDKVSFSIQLDSAFVGLKSIEAKGHADLAIALSKDPITANKLNASFTMPNYDVVLVPTYEAKKSASIALSFDATLLKSASLTGDTSRNVLSKNGESALFLVGETLTITASNADAYKNKYALSMKVTEGDSVTTIEPRYTSGGTAYFAPYTVKENTSAIAFEAKENAALAATVENPDGIALTYSVNGLAVEDLTATSLYSGDTLMVNSATSLPEGYSIKVLNSDTSQALTPNTYGVYTITSNIQVVVKKEDIKTTASITFEKPDDLYAKVVNKDTGGTIYANGYGSIAIGTTISLGKPFGGSDYHAVVTIGGSIVAEGDVTSATGSLEFVLTGDATITLTALA